VDAISVVFIFTLLGCSSGDDFAQRLENELNKGNVTIARFSELTDFEWSSVSVYGPYQSLDAINNKHTIHLSGEYFSHVAGCGNHIPLQRGLFPNPGPRRIHKGDRYF
jgi:hypothetical protein